MEIKKWSEHEVPNDARSIRAGGHALAVVTSYANAAHSAFVLLQCFHHAHHERQSLQQVFGIPIFLPYFRWWMIAKLTWKKN